MYTFGAVTAIRFEGRRNNRGAAWFRGYYCMRDPEERITIIAHAFLKVGDHTIFI